MQLIDFPSWIDRIIEVDYLNPVAVMLRLLAVILSWLGIIEIDI